MPTKPPVIVHTDYRRKRPPKRKTPVVIPMRIVSAKKPGPAITGSRIVTARPKRGRFGPVPDLTDEEHQRRGDAAEALFREIVRRVKGE